LVKKYTGIEKVLFMVVRFNKRPVLVVFKKSKSFKDNKKLFEKLLFRVGSLSGFWVLFAKNKPLVWVTNEVLSVLNNATHFILLLAVIDWP
jgi:hypothetical protein